jgi:hypothetical protein
VSIAGAEPIAVSRPQPTSIRRLVSTASTALAFREWVRFAKMVARMTKAVGLCPRTVGTK